MARKLARRSFLAQIGAAGGALALIAGSAKAQPAGQGARYSGVTDCDLGNPQDAPGYGRGTSNRYTDSDTGPNADPRCQGRGPRGANAPSGAGDYSYGAPEHPATQQPATGCSDRDPSDPGGRGLRCTPGSGSPAYSGCSDRDPGDPIGNGRNCRR